MRVALRQYPKRWRAVRLAQPYARPVEERAHWLDRVASIRRWSRGGERAPHKPLLLLYALGRLQRTGQSRVSFADAEPDVTRLLSEFGPARATTPAYPFHHLQTDGLWSWMRVGLIRGRHQAASGPAAPSVSSIRRSRSPFVGIRASWP